MPQFESEFEQNLYSQRLEKLEAIKAIGQRLGLSEAESVYPNRFPTESETLASIPELLQRYDEAHPGSAEQLEADKPEVAVAGRLMSIRLQGKAGFAHLQQGGKRLQIYVRRDDVGEDAFALYKLLDLGDHIGVRGVLMRTRTGELTLKALPVAGKPAISFLAKAMLALPDKYHGLEDVELRYRQRYVDLIMNSGTLTKAEASAAPSTLTEVSSRPEAQSAGVERPAVPPPGITAMGKNNVGAGVEKGFSATFNDAKTGASAPGLPPGASPVTDTAAPNEEHNDAPRNVREVFVKRAAILRAIRKFFDDRDYLEVETPMMHTIAGGAAARPFTTHHNALDLDLSLRIAPELYLKRLVVGGMDRVYEINRNFRNEGVSTQHNPEFTMLEFYQAYSNYHDLMDLTQELIQFVAMEVNGTTKTWFNGETIDLATQNWTKLSMREAIVKFWPDEEWDARPSTTQIGDRREWVNALTRARDLLNGRLALAHLYGDESSSPLAFIYDPKNTTRKSQAAFLERLIGDLQGESAIGKSIAEVFELLAEPHLIQPTIIYDFPLAVSPLSKVKPDESDWVERFEFYIGGFEVGNAFSELNDPVDQRQRFEAQLEQKARGDDEAMAEMDEDYVRALGYGLPPTAGEGIGIDRLTMLLTGSRSIRDVILFPLMRPRTDSGTILPGTSA